MKKIYTLGLFLAAATLSFGQIDLSASLDNHTNLDNTSDDPLNMDFTIRNLGDSIPPTDTIYYGISIGGGYYTVDTFMSGTVNGVSFVNGFPSGAQYSVDVSDLLGSFLMTELGGSSGLVCSAVLGVGAAVLTSPFAGDANALNNAECVNWSDASSVAEEDYSQISVYPNPASEDVYFNLGTVEVDQIQVMDLSGRVIDVININGSIETLDVKAYESGIYFYAVLRGDAVLTTEKFIVSK